MCSPRNRAAIGQPRSRDAIRAHSLSRLACLASNPLSSTMTDLSLFIAKSPCSSHPNPSGRRLADRPRLVGRCHKYMPPVTPVTPHRTRRARPFSLDHVYVGKEYYCLWINQDFFVRSILYLFVLDRRPPPSHNYSFYHSSLPPYFAVSPSPSSTMRLPSRT